MKNLGFLGFFLEFNFFKGILAKLNKIRIFFRNFRAAGQPVSTNTYFRSCKPVFLEGQDGLVL